MVDFEQELERIRQESEAELEEMREAFQRSAEKMMRIARISSWFWLGIAVVWAGITCLDVAFGARAFKCIADAFVSGVYFFLFGLFRVGSRR